MIKLFLFFSKKDVKKQMSYQENLIKMQTKNLFDVPLDVETSFDNPNKEMNMNDIEIGAGLSPFKLGQVGGNTDFTRKINIEENTDLTDLDEVNLDQMSEFGDIETIQKGGDLELFDTIDKTGYTQPIVGIPEPAVNLEHNIQQGGGQAFDNPEGLEISEITDNNEEDIEEYGNLDNMGEDFLNADDEQFDEQPKNETSTWINPELTIENDSEMIVKMNQDEIDTKVAMYIDYYNSDEYQEYLKYYQIVYSASSQKYTIRRDTKSNIYLVRRFKDKDAGKDKQGAKKNKESVQEMLAYNNTEPKSYLIKLTPPEYLNINDELNKINNELNILSGEIKIIQKDLIELGDEISKDDIKAFDKVRNKFYKLINRKYIYSKYYLDVNNIIDTEEKTNIYASEVITYTDKNDIDMYKVKSYNLSVSNNIIDDMTLQLKNNLEKYIAIHDNTDIKNEKEYKQNIKDFLINKKHNEDKNKKEFNVLINSTKSRVNFIIKKLPKVDVKEEP
jgi:hypothetical protein